jgi:hypothetical protein
LTREGKPPWEKFPRIPFGIPAHEKSGTLRAGAMRESCARTLRGFHHVAFPADRRSYPVWLLI